MDKKIFDYINRQNPQQRKILKKVREIFFKTLPGCSEEAKWGVIAFAGGKFYAAALRDSVNIGFAIKGLGKEEMSFFRGSGKTMRHIKIKTLEDIDEKHLAKMIRLVNKKAVCKPC